MRSFYVNCNHRSIDRRGEDFTLRQAKKLRDTLNAWLNQPRITEAEFEQQLLDQGLLRQLPAPITDCSAYRNRQPIQVTGRPLSETIIEERGE